MYLRKLIVVALGVGFEAISFAGIGKRIESFVDTAKATPGNSSHLLKYIQSELPSLIQDTDADHTEYLLANLCELWDIDKSHTGSWSNVKQTVGHREVIFDLALPVIKNAKNGLTLRAKSVLKNEMTNASGRLHRLSAAVIAKSYKYADFSEKSAIQNILIETAKNSSYLEVRVAALKKIVKLNILEPEELQDLIETMSRLMLLFPSEKSFFHRQNIHRVNVIAFEKLQQAYVSFLVQNLAIQNMPRVLAIVKQYSGKEMPFLAANFREMNAESVESVLQKRHRMDAIEGVKDRHHVFGSMISRGLMSKGCSGIFE